MALDCYLCLNKEKETNRKRVKLNMAGENTVSGALCHQAIVTFFVR